MKRILYLFIAVSTLLFVASCSDDELTSTQRAQDEAGKIFLEKGNTVTANTNFDQSALEKALKQKEWTLDYSFNYDKFKVGEKSLEKALPIALHTDMTIEYRFEDVKSKIRAITLSGKQLTSTMIDYRPHENTYWPAQTYTVVALDNDRIIMDSPLGYFQIEGYDQASARIRSVWVPAK